jgi:hypothetical protein
MLTNGMENGFVLEMERVYFFGFWPGWIVKVKTGAVNFSADMQSATLTQVIGSSPVKNRGVSS